MSKIEENSFLTQIKLMIDIISNYKNITYSVARRGIEIRELLATKKINETEKTVTLDRETFDKLLDIAYILQEERKWEKLGILAEKAVPDNETKIEILKLLQK